MKHSRKDLSCAAVFIVVGLSFAAGSFQYGFGSSVRPGPGYFPLGLGLLLAAVGAMLLVQALRLPAPDGDPIGALAWRPLGFVLGAVVLFGFLLPRAGLLVALPVLVALAAQAGADRRWREIVVSAVALTALSWLVFSQGLGLALPLWPGF